jgi:predicted RNA-binding Zn ribbon-like protein
MGEVQSLDELPFVAGAAALDFVNSAEERGHPAAGDVLLSPADLRLWGQRYGLLARSLRPGPDAGSELARALEARELLYAVFLDRVRGRAPRPHQLARLARLAAEAYGAGTLRAHEDRSVSWGWSTASLETVRHVAVTSAVELLGTTPSPRLKQCPGDHCGWFFLDRTKRGNRRWCRMSECGQDAKDERRRRQRHRAGGSG